MTKQELETLKVIYERESGILDVKSQYEEYSKFDTPRNFEKMKSACVLEDYLKFMSDCENFLAGNKSVMKMSESSDIEIPQPSDALKKFKDMFNKFF